MRWHRCARRKGRLFGRTTVRECATVRSTGTRGFSEGSGGAVVRTATVSVAPDNGKKSLLGGLVASGLPLATAAGLPTAAGLAAALALAPAVTTTARESATLLARLLLWLAAALLARLLLRLAPALPFWLRLAATLPFGLRLAGTLLAGLLLTAVFASGMSHASSFQIRDLPSSLSQTLPSETHKIKRFRYQ